MEPDLERERRLRNARLRARIGGRGGESSPPDRPAGSAGAASEAEAGGGLLAHLWATALGVPERVSGVDVLGRAIFWLAMAFYGWHFIGLEVYRSQTQTSTVAWLIGMANLVFHEAGHIILSPLGDFMATLGGSLFQVLVPLVCMLAFLTRYPDPFGASAMLWWSGESLVELAPYIHDASSQRLVLLGGVTGRDVPGYHDWNHLLGRLGWLEHDAAIARAVDTTGTLLIAVAIVWAGYQVLGQWRMLQRGGRAA